jgi:hypothetical protein
LWELRAVNLTSRELRLALRRRQSTVMVSDRGRELRVWERSLVEAPEGDQRLII